MTPDNKATSPMATSPYLNRSLRSEAEARWKHTPGPWTAAKGPKIRDGIHIRANGRYVASINHFKNYETGEIADEAIANARLITAAPELLHAAKCGLAQLEMAHNEAFGKGCDGTCSYHEAMRILRRTIAKAEGRRASAPDDYSARDKVREEIANNPDQWE